MTDKVFMMYNVGGTLLFRARYDTFGLELWKSDGSPEGTMFVKDICPGPIGLIPEGPVPITAFTGGHGTPLFRMSTDGGAVSWSIREPTVRFSEVGLRDRAVMEYLAGEESDDADPLSDVIDLLSGIAVD